MRRLRSSLPSHFTGLLLASCMVPALLAGCAATPKPGDKEAQAEYQENNDPLEPTNRVMYSISDGLDTVLLRPLAVVYRNAVPSQVRTPVGNLVANLNNPVIFANDVLQGSPKRAGNTFMRLLVNTTLGVGGLFDVAGHNGFPAHDNDFGITMALWGVPTGPFLFLPVLGPSNPRDATGYGVDIAMDPITWPANGGGFNAFRLTRGGVEAVDMREKALDATDSIKKTSLDPYATYRSLYQQHRQSVIDEMRPPQATPTAADQPIIGTQSPR